MDSGPASAPRGPGLPPLTREHQGPVSPLGFHVKVCKEWVVCGKQGWGVGSLALGQGGAVFLGFSEPIWRPKGVTRSDEDPTLGAQTSQKAPSGTGLSSDGCQGTAVDLRQGSHANCMLRSFQPQL